MSSIASNSTEPALAQGPMAGGPGVPPSGSRSLSDPEYREFYTKAFYFFPLDNSNRMTAHSLYSLLSYKPLNESLTLKDCAQLIGVLKEYAHSADERASIDVNTWVKACLNIAAEGQISADQATQRVAMALQGSNIAELMTLLRAPSDLTSEELADIHKIITSPALQQ